MQNTNSLTQVAEFHATFKHPIVERPTIPSSERCALRVELISEELKELAQAIKDKNIIEVADALCDLQYVLSGAVLEFGLGKLFKLLFDEVHRSNMSKACETVEQAEATIQAYFEKDGTRSYWVHDNGLYLIYREGDDKTLKSIDYSPANLKMFL